MDIGTIAGWLAAGFTLTAFSSRTMIPLRLSALCASACFIVFGTLSGAYPVLALHCVLLPFNAWRLYEIMALDRAASEARKGRLPLDWIRHVVRPQVLRDGAYIFRKGDPPDTIYYLSKGQIELEELGITLSEGEIFGEIAFFTNAHERTLSARAVGDCEVLVIGERDFMRLYGQNPAFSMYIMRLVAGRLLDGIERDHTAYVPLGTGRADAAE